MKPGREEGGLADTVDLPHTLKVCGGARDGEVLTEREAGWLCSDGRLKIRGLILEVEILPRGGR